MTGETMNPQPIKFDKSFTQEVEKYLKICYKKKHRIPTLQGFAERIGTNAETVIAWANKKKKDEQGNVIDQLARPLFFAAIEKLQQESQKKEEKVEKDIEEGLNEKQEAFCQMYTSPDVEFFGNGVQSYIEVYQPNESKPNWYKNACSSASQLLSNIKVCRRINELLEEGGLNDSNVDRQLLFLINQFDDKSTKLAAIREYNKVKERIIDKVDLTSKGEKIAQVVGFNVLPPAKSDVTDHTNTQADS